MVDETIALGDLLSSCVEANRQACEIVRSHAARTNVDDGGSRWKEEGNARSVVTEADVEAQRRIVSLLRREWGGNLRIVGEEEDDDDDVECDEDSSIRRDDDDDVARSSLRDDPLLVVPSSELTVFVDPLDGTREFVEGRRENAACLIGVARKGVVVAGVVGTPFPEIVVRYAAVPGDRDAVRGRWTEEENNDAPAADDDDDDEEALTVYTGDSSDPLLRAATDAALTSRPRSVHRVRGGAAAKLLAVVEAPGPAAAVFHFDTCAWDTCAPEALLRAAGGRLSDLFGASLVHDGNVVHRRGVVASNAAAAEAHAELCRRARADPVLVRALLGESMGPGEKDDDVGPQAVDLARDLDGEPLSVERLGTYLAPADGSHRLARYTVPEAEAFRGLMSNGCRLRLEWESVDGDDDSSPPPPPPSSVFYKRVVMVESADALSKLRSNHRKLQRDVESYRVESAFLTSRACRRLVDKTGIRIPRVLHSDLRPCSDADGTPTSIVHGRFALLLEDLGPFGRWRQEWLLSESSAGAALDALADLHGFFWEGSDVYRDDDIADGLERAVWANGGYTGPAQQGVDQCDRVAAGYAARLPSFREALSNTMPGVDLDAIGDRLQRVARRAAEEAHPFVDVRGVPRRKGPNRAPRTLIHGDPKPANFFFRDTGDTAEAAAALVDFQWTGFGAAATDVAHFVCAALASGCRDDPAVEARLLARYRARLARALVRSGAAASEEEAADERFPTFARDYETAVLDVGRLVFAYAWKRWRPETEPTAASSNRNAYNKCETGALWLVRRCHEILNKRETEEKQRSS